MKYELRGIVHYGCERVSKTRYYVNRLLDALVRRRHLHRDRVAFCFSALTILMSLSLSSLPTYSETSKSRLQALYSDISRQKHSNPASFHANVDWWKRTLQALVVRGWQAHATEARETNKLVLSASRELAERFRFEGVGKPLGLGAIIVSIDRLLCSGKT